MGKTRRGWLSTQRHALTSHAFVKLNRGLRGAKPQHPTSDRVVIGVEFPGAPVLFWQSAHEVDAHADRPLYLRKVGRGGLCSLVGGK